MGMRHFFFLMKMRVRAALFALVTAVVLVAGCTYEFGDASDEPLPLRVSFIDVGQGLAVLFENDGWYAMYDIGPDSAGVVDSLVARGVDTLEWVLVSHYHRDHAGGFWEVAGRGASSGEAGAESARVHVRRLIVGPDTAGGFVRDSVLRVARRLGIPVDTLYRGDVLGLADSGLFPGSGDVPQFDVLWPPDYVQEGGNPASVVLRVEYGMASALLTGDLDSAGEHRLLELSPTLSAGLLQIGHHGSAGSSSLRFISQVAPDYAAVSVGAGNRYGHPRESVVRKYGYVLGDSSFLYRTDLQGSVAFEMWPGIGILSGQREDK